VSGVGVVVLEIYCNCVVCVLAVRYEFFLWRCFGDVLECLEMWLDVAKCGLVSSRANPY
jgi:hypothetical protein